MHRCAIFLTHTFLSSTKWRQIEYIHSISHNIKVTCFCILIELLYQSLLLSLFFSSSIGWMLTCGQLQWMEWGAWINPPVYHSQHAVLFIDSLWGNSNWLQSGSDSRFLLLDLKRLSTFLFPPSRLWLHFSSFSSPTLHNFLLMKKDIERIVFRD